MSLGKTEIKKRQDDVIFAVLMFILALIVRFMFQTKFLYHWDSANFALSLQHYDVRLHQPHPPGYFLYSMLGIFVNQLIHDANASLVWISTISGALGVLVIFFTARDIFNRKVAYLASIFTLTSPLHWFISEVALSYALEFVFVTLLAWLSFKQITNKKKPWLLFAFLLGIAGGIRQNDLVFLLPLWFYSLYFISWRQRIGSFLILAGTIVAWMLPMLALSGGLSGYMAALQSESSGILSESSIFSIYELLLNAFRLGMYTFYGLILLLPLLASGLFCLLKRFRKMLFEQRFWLFSLWIVPSFLFYLFIHIRQAGHIFTYYPALLILSSASIVFFEDRIKLGTHRLNLILPGVIVLVNILFFMVAPASLFGSDRLPLQTPSRNSIIKRDTFWKERIDLIYKKFDPETTVLLAGGQNFRHLDYYFSDFQLSGLSYKLGDEIIIFPENINTFVILSPIDDLSYPLQQFEIIQMTDNEPIFYLSWSSNETLRLSRTFFNLE